MVIDKIRKMSNKGVKLKSESFFSISTGVLQLWRKNLRGGGFRPPPGPDRVNDVLQISLGRLIAWQVSVFSCTLSELAFTQERGKEPLPRPACSRRAQVSIGQNFCRKLGSGSLDLSLKGSITVNMKNLYSSLLTTLNGKDRKAHKDFH